MANILYLAQFLSLDNEPGGQGQRHYQHAKALAEDGHSVTVITSGQTTMSIPGQDFEKTHAKPEWTHPNLRIVKINNPPMGSRCVLSRAVRYFSFSTKALLAGLRLGLVEHRSFQYVLGSSPPLLIALVAWVLSVVFRAEFLMEVRDLWSQTMAANGFINNRLAIALNRWLESFLYAQSSRIIILSSAFGPEVVRQAPGAGGKIVYIPNGADLEFYEYPKLWRGSYLKNGAEKKEPALFNVIYAGVFSDYTKLEVVLEAAALLKESHPHIRFNMAGGGYQLQQLKEMARSRGLSNVRFWGVLPKSRITRFLMEGDLNLINYRNLDIFRKVLPNKIFDYLASGRPVLACVPEGEISKVLDESGAGRYIEPENPEALAEAIVWYSRNPRALMMQGQQGQLYVRRNFARNRLVDKLLALFPRVIPLEAARDAKRRFGIREAAVNQNNVIPFPNK